MALFFACYRGQAVIPYLTLFILNKPMTCLPDLPDLQPRLRGGLFEYPVHHMRGGTSTGLLLWDACAPAERHLREELLRHLMGVPLSGQQRGNRQVTGLGRGSPTSNKVFFVGAEQYQGQTRLVSTLAQLASEHGDIDWSVNCGNMSSAIQLWALDTGLAEAAIPGQHQIDIRNTNTGVITTSRMARQADGRYVAARIPGVQGEFPSVDLFLHDPAGAKTGALLPTGAAEDVILGYRVSCVDVAVPMVIADAAQFGKTAHESMHALEADLAFMETIRKLWVAAGLSMGLKRRDGQPMSADELARSETIPKFCIVGAPQAGGNLAVRYFTPQAGHASLAVSGGCCLAAAALRPGSVAYQLAQGVARPGPDYGDIEVGLENPAGILAATIVARRNGDAIDIGSAAYRRSAQILVRGHVPLYRASDELRACLYDLWHWDAGGERRTCSSATNVA